MRAWLFALLLTFSVIHPAAAVILYTSPGFAGAISCNASCGGAISDFHWGATSNQLAEQFVLGVDSTIDELSWVGSRGEPEDFTVNFYNTRVDGLPALRPFASFHVGNSFTQFDIGALPSLFSADLSSPVALFAGVPYYISIVANSVSSEGAWAWYDGGVGASRVQLQGGFDDWRVILPTFDRVSFGLLLSGSRGIPEPGTLTLLVLGLAGIALSRRRRRV